jgi:hypothetical protein
MKPLCLIIQSLTHFNSYNLDSNCETLLQGAFFLFLNCCTFMLLLHLIPIASKLPPDCISNTRKVFYDRLQ